MKKLRFLAIAMAAALSFSLASCGDDPTEYDGLEMHEGDFIEIEGYGYDTTAAYPAHFKVTLQNDSLIITNMSSLNNAASQALLGERNCPTAASIADMGKVKSLSKINHYAGANDYKAGVPAVEGHGYVVLAVGNAHFNEGYNNPDIHDLSAQHMRIWLEEAIEDGYKVRYEFPFKEEE